VRAVCLWTVSKNSAPVRTVQDVRPACECSGYEEDSRAWRRWEQARIGEVSDELLKLNYLQRLFGMSSASIDYFAYMLVWHITSDPATKMQCSFFGLAARKG